MNVPNSNEDNSESEKEKIKSNQKKKKTNKELLHKEKELKKKLKKIRKKNKKNKNKEDQEKYGFDCGYLEDILMNQDDIDRLPHDDFVTYKIPNTLEENKDYIPLLISESDIILELLDARDIYHSRNTQIEEIIKYYDSVLAQIENEFKFDYNCLSISDSEENLLFETDLITIILTTLTNEYEVKNVEAFSQYLKQVWKDLSGRKQRRKKAI